MLLGLQKSSVSSYSSSREILTCAQMREADRLTVAGGAAGYELMTAAGQAVANVVHAFYPDHTVLVLCGPGNNGGDGYVAAMFLEGLGHGVRVMSLVAGWKLKGDARKAKADWGGKVTGFTSLPDLPRETVVVDAVFGVGLSKPLMPQVTNIFADIKDKGWPVIAVDIPSGVNGDTGAADPHTLEAAQTVTFFRKKLGHMLAPGMMFCGQVSVHDIGIADQALIKTGFVGYENEPALWQEKLPHPQKSGHKYSRGHLVILGGARMTGAARLSSEAAMRMGAGLCTIAAAKETALVYQRAAAHVLYEALAGYADFARHIEDERRNVVLIGPGAGLEDVKGLRQAVLTVLASGKAAVLDADALTCFADEPEILYGSLHDKCVLTPHEGEFGRVFPALQGSKLARAQAAASATGAIILLKGPDTVIAQAEKTPVINIHATPWLATAGAGDVLAGMIAGLMAQDVPAFEAACAASWIHGEAGVRKGPGLVAPDIIEEVPAVLRDFS